MDLEASGLAFGFRKAQAVLRDLELLIPSGQLVALIGANGAGKSTLLRCLARLLRPTRGTVSLGGKEIGALSAEELARMEAAVLTDRVAPLNMTAGEVIALGRLPRQGLLGRMDAQDRAAVEKAAVAMGVAGLLDRSFGELSDGQKQKVLIARALAQEPRVMILDEPTSFLDLRARLEVLALLRGLARKTGMSLLVSTHDLELVSRYADRVVILQDGRLVASGIPEEVLCGEVVRDLYGAGEGSWSPLFGSVELSATGNGSREVFVVAGNGTGVPVYRLLVRGTVGFATGVLMGNDVDAHLAAVMGVPAASTPPFEAPTPGEVEAVFRAYASARCVIDSGFPVNPASMHNLQLVRRFLEGGKMVACIRPRGEARELYGTAKGVRCTSLREVPAILGGASGEGSS